MIPVNVLCKRRNISPFEVSTPILVPSFSSKGFPYLNEKRWKPLRQQVVDNALVSCYDIYYGYIENEINEPNLLFLDSGGYEARKDFESSEAYKDSNYVPSDWTRDKHIEAVEQKLTTYSALVLVSYDEADKDKKISLSKQIDFAKVFFSRFPEAAKCFLVKPFESNKLTISELQEYVHLFGHFDIIGLTEDELGDSLLSRLDNLVKLRGILIENDLDVPLHIFGSLEPLSNWLFYLCGADIFDGLSWLRFAFDQNQALYSNSWVIQDGNISLKDDERRLTLDLKNLRFLEAQKLQMIRFARDYDLSLIPNFRQLRSILKTVGVDLTSKGENYGR